MNDMLMAHCGTAKASRQDLMTIPVPLSTRTFKPVPHIEIVNALIETLGFRNISVLRDEYAVSPDGMKMFGVMEIEQGFDGCRFAIGLRNSNDKSMRLALTVGFRVFVCDNLSFHGDFTPVLAKHSAKLSIMDSLAIGADRIQRNFEPMRKQVDGWKATQISDDQARLYIYRAFIESELEVPRSLIRSVHNNYFNPPHIEFAPRTAWSLQNAFTESLKTLDPLAFFKSTAKFGNFFNDLKLGLPQGELIDLS